MNELTVMTSATMTSKEIADLVESRHDSVKRTVERLSNQHVISQPPLVDGTKSANGVIETALPNGRIYPQPMFTGKGMIWIQHRIDHELMGVRI